MPFGEQRMLFSLLFGEDLTVKTGKEPTLEEDATVSPIPVDLGISALYQVFDMPSPSPIHLTDEEMDFLNRLVVHIRGGEDDSPQQRKLRAEAIEGFLAGER